jgi:hypothetical protein
MQVLIVVEDVAEEITVCGKALRQGTDGESVGSQRRSSSSAQSIGADTGAPAAGRGLYGATNVLLIAFWV